MLSSEPSLVSHQLSVLLFLRNPEPTAVLCEGEVQSLLGTFDRNYVGKQEQWWWACCVLMPHKAPSLRVDFCFLMLGREVISSFGGVIRDDARRGGHRPRICGSMFMTWMCNSCISCFMSSSYFLNLCFI